MTFSEVGTATGLNSAGCLISSVNYALTTQKGKNTIFLSTTDDTECQTGTNTFVETATLTITGGTGIFSSATGTGTINFTGRFHPRNTTATANFTITY